MTEYSFSTLWKFREPIESVWDELFHTERLPGRGALSEKGEETTIKYEWNVRTNKSLMNFLAPVAHPFFNWNHDTVMDKGSNRVKKQA